MNKVYPIKNEDLKKMREYFLLKNNIVMYHLLNIGVNVALRISDLLQLKFENIEKISNKRMIAKIKEQKTGKVRIVTFNEVARKSVTELKTFYKKSGYEEKGYLFKSMLKTNYKNKRDIPITRYGVNKHLYNAKDFLNIPYAIGTHSLRKTWGKNAFEKSNSIGLVSMALGHSSEKVTQRYIGIQEEDIQDFFEDLKI